MEKCVTFIMPGNLINVIFITSILLTFHETGVCKQLSQNWEWDIAHQESFENNNGSDVRPISERGEIGKPISRNVNGNTEYIIEYTYEHQRENQSHEAFRVSIVAHNSSGENPMLVVVRQQKAVVSWQVPLILQNVYEYAAVGRTLCPSQITSQTPTTASTAAAATDKPVTKRFFVEISTSSYRAIGFTLNTTILGATGNDQFVVGTNMRYTYKVSPSEPVFYKYIFPTDVDSVTVQVDSQDTVCMDVSVQETLCPVYDLDNNVQFTGSYQTATRKAAIKVMRSELKTCSSSSKSNITCAFYIVFVIKPNDLQCTGDNAMMVIDTSHSAQRRSKIVHLIVHPEISFKQYMIAIVGAVGLFFMFYVAAMAIAIIHFISNYRGSDGPTSTSTHSKDGTPDEQSN